MTIDVSQYPSASRNNKAAIEEAGRCSCYFCARLFAANEIEQWVDGGKTPLCPHCGIDALLPGSSSESDLAEGLARYFTSQLTA